MSRVEFQEKHEWIVFFCLALVIGRLFWHEQLYVDVYTIIFFVIALLFLYKEEWINFIYENVESFNLGKEGLGAKLRGAKWASRKVDELEAVVEDLPGEAVMRSGSDLPAEGMGTPKAGLFVGAHQKYAGHILPPDQHAGLWQSLHKEVDQLKAALRESSSSSLMEAIIHASEKKLITAETKKLLLTFEDTLRTMTQFHSFISSDKVITMSYVVSKLIPKIKAESGLDDK